MTQLPPPASDAEIHAGDARASNSSPTDSRPTDSRTGSGRTRLVIILVAVGVALALVVVLAFFAIASIQQLASRAPQSTISASEVSAATNIIVLQASDAQGKGLSGADMSAAEGVIVHRLERAGIAVAKVAYSGENVYVIFDDEATAAVTSAVDVVSIDYRLGFRRVMEASGVCSEIPATAGSVTEGGIVACERDSIAGYVLGPVELEGERVTQVEASEVSDGQWAVNLVFDAQGAKRFAVLTSELSTAQGVGNQFAMVLDGEVLSAPRVLTTITDGNPQISGNFDRHGAESLANELRLASRGVSFTVESTRTG